MARRLVGIVAAEPRLPGEEIRICGDAWVRIFYRWKECPWYGDAGLFRTMDGTSGWAPRRTYYECFRMLTGEDLPNDPLVWEAWFEAHPNLVWDEKQKKLAEP